MLYSRKGHRGKTRKTAIERWPAPSRGWIASQRLVGASPDGAEVLDNYFPTAEGARVRRGSTLHATAGAAVTGLHTYRSGSQELLIATTGTAIYDVSNTADPEDAGTPVLSGFSQGDWSSVQVATAGGEFLLMVNGEEWVMYDGTDWEPVASANTFNLGYDNLSASFAFGETVTGATSGATAQIWGIAPTSETAGTLKVISISGTFQDNEQITDGAAGDATANIPSGTTPALTVSISGVEEPSHLWNHKSRVWAVRENTLSVYYGGVNAITGSFSEFPLYGIFNDGGAVLFGATISIDSGEGMDDRLVVVTTEGEMAVYGGTDPSSADTWALEGVYRIGRPLGKNAHFKSGGDLVVLTEEGVVSVLKALTMSGESLIQSALSAPIEDAWQSIVARRSLVFPFSVTLWRSQTMLLIGTPTESSSNPQSFVANARTGAWSRYTGWDVQCSAVYQDGLYFGTSSGAIVHAESGGTDLGLPYYATFVPKFSECRNFGDKFLISAKIAVRSPEDVIFRLTGLSNYETSGINVALPSTAENLSTWGTAIWGSSVWGGSGSLVTYSSWQEVSSFGSAISVGVEIGVSRTSAPSIELIEARALYETGSPL